VLDGNARPFHDLALEPAPADAVAAWVERVRPSRASLDVGELLLQPAVRFSLDAGGFDRHTFFCGQSGSGKTYALGTILEQLLLQTSLRLVILDPNSDFVRLGEPRDSVDEDLASRYRQAAEGVVVRSVGEGPERLHVRFRDFDPVEQAAVLRLDPIRNRDEYGALVEILEGGLTSCFTTPGELVERLATAEGPEFRALAARIRNLGLHR
jgi:DNA helicase HerA-like ATPase